MAFIIDLLGFYIWGLRSQRRKTHSCSLKMGLVPAFVTFLLLWKDPFFDHCLCVFCALRALPLVWIPQRAPTSWNTTKVITGFESSWIWHDLSIIVLLPPTSVHSRSTSGLEVGFSSEAWQEFLATNEKVSCRYHFLPTLIKKASTSSSQVGMRAHDRCWLARPVASHDYSNFYYKILPKQLQGQQQLFDC